jgi:hypothetical protein
MPYIALPPYKDEKLIKLINEHWMILISPFSLYALGLALGGFLFWLSDNLHDLAHPAAMVLAFVAYFVLLITHHWFFIYLLSLELSGWAITQKRIIEFQFLPYVRHDMIYINIDDVTESEKRQHGVLKNLFHYGEVELNLASSGETIEFRYVPYPGIFVEKISLPSSS